MAVRAHEVTVLHPPHRKRREQLLYLQSRQDVPDNTSQGSLSSEQPPSYCCMSVRKKRQNTVTTPLPASLFADVIWLQSLLNRCGCLQVVKEGNETSQLPRHCQIGRSTKLDQGAQQAISCICSHLTPCTFRTCGVTSDELSNTYKRSYKAQGKGSIHPNSFTVRLIRRGKRLVCFSASPPTS